VTDLYQFLTGPGLWITFTVFIGGMLVRLVFLYGLSRGRDKVMYNHADAGWAMKSIMHWLLPWTNASTRSQPVFAGVFYLFHICILAVPLFLAAHNLMWDEAFGISLWSMPDKVADWLTLVVIACGVFLIARRIYRPEVRILTTAWDYFLILLTMAPFVTGYLAYHAYSAHHLLGSSADGHPLQQAGAHGSVLLLPRRGRVRTGRPQGLQGLVAE